MFLEFFLLGIGILVHGSASKLLAQDNLYTASNDTSKTLINVQN